MKWGCVNGPVLPTSLEVLKMDIALYWLYRADLLLRDSLWSILE